MSIRVWMVVVVVLCASIAACKEKYDGPTWQEKQMAEVAPILEKFREPARARLELIRKVGKAAADAPRVTEVMPSSIAEKKLQVANDFRSEGDTVIMNIEWAEKPGLVSTADMKFRISEEPGLRLLSKWVETGIKAEEGDARGVERGFTFLLAKKYALILRVYEVTKASTSGLAGGKLRYSPGRVIGDALLFDIESAKSVGAFPFDIVQSREASVSVGEDEAVALENSLRFDVLWGLRTRLDTFVEGGAVQVGDGAVGATADFKQKLLFAFNTPDFLAAYIGNVELGERGDKTLVTIYAMSPSLLEGKMDQVKSIVASELGVDDAIIELKKSDDTKSE